MNDMTAGYVKSALDYHALEAGAIYLNVSRMRL